VLHDEDLARGYGQTIIPDGLNQKYPSAAREFIWQFVFPARKLSQDPRTGVFRRHHVFESGLQKDGQKGGDTVRDK